jgi:hypothetical protein
MSDMMGGCKKGGGNCGALDCAWGCCYPPARSVPTGVVPRVTVLEAVLRTNPLSMPLRPDPIAQAVDNYMLMERKARAWDELYVRAHDDLSLLALMEGLVHPAPDASKR